jgi:hypothetical protein
MEKLHEKIWYYFEVAFMCDECEKPFAYTIRLHTYNQKDVTKKLMSGAVCPRCNKVSHHEVLKVIELEISHLEEYIRYI